MLGDLETPFSKITTVCVLIVCGFRGSEYVSTTLRAPGAISSVSSIGVTISTSGRVSSTPSMVVNRNVPSERRLPATSKTVPFVDTLRSRPGGSAALERIVITLPETVGVPKRAPLCPS